MKEKGRRGVNKIVEKGRKRDSKKAKRIRRTFEETTRRIIKKTKRRWEIEESWRKEINILNKFHK